MSLCSCGCATAYELQVWMMETIVSTRCFELDPLRVSDIGSHCDPAEAFTNRDMTETTMQISLTASGLSQATNVLGLGSTLNYSGWDEGTALCRKHQTSEYTQEFVEQLFLNCGGEQTTSLNRNPCNTTKELLKDTKRRWRFITHSRLAALSS